MSLEKTGEQRYQTLQETPGYKNGAKATSLAVRELLGNTKTISSGRWEPKLDCKNISSEW